MIIYKADTGVAFMTTPVFKFTYKTQKVISLGASVKE
jgi:hypothetical protein